MVAEQNFHLPFSLTVINNVWRQEYETLCKYRL